MKTSDVLIKARENLITKGWCRLSIKDEFGRVCSMGAVVHTEVDISNRMKAYDFLRGFTDDSIGLWNDEPGRTFEEVLEVFDDAISAAMSDEALES